ncbi:DUF4166 domain-containing protein [Aliiroseovarius sp. S253]|uniref:DUF4166 domain-containing protein n=1 Tax=Aliiroseovarius sp. S253 TaxID=3415133 RepID=UPI003C7CA8E3
MKVLVLGGSGVFGSRLAQLLVRDGHNVTVAGRNLSNAQSMAESLGCGALQLDRDGDLSVLPGYDVLVDAAGPFHTYGADPYRLARGAISGGVHYLDLSDNAPFCEGISALDAEAKAANVCAISGMSSVPALSSAAVRALVGDDHPDKIEVAILPGNRTPRGLSVIASILSQAGRPMKVFRNGKWTSVPGWSDPKTYDLPGEIRRQGWLIEVPDVTLFPKHFAAQSVIFRAGLELAAMRYGLSAFARFRRRVPVPITGPILRVFKLAADLLSPFGSDSGGMLVSVTVGQEQRSWRLRVDHGDGPFIPAIAVRALLRRDALPVGSGPALETITLTEAETDMSDLHTFSEKSNVVRKTIFQQVLGPDFDNLPKAVRATHLTRDTSRWSGNASVTRGEGLWSRCLAWLFRFPKAAGTIPVEVTKTVTPKGETWLRSFGGSRFRSHLAATPQGMTERFGPFTFRVDLTVANGSLNYPVSGGRLGPLPLPTWLLPISEAREFEDDGRFHFDVKLSAPITGGLLVHYEGTLSQKAPTSND